MWRAIFIFLFLIPHVQAAEGLDLTVRGEKRLTAGAYTYRNISVEEGATLTLTGSVSIFFTGQGGISGKGSLRVEGRPGAEVFLAGEWKGISLQGGVELRYLHIIGNTERLVFGASSSLDHVTVRDAQASTITFIPQGKDVSIRTVRIITPLLETVEAGLVFQGKVGEVWLQGLTLPRKHQIKNEKVVVLLDGYKGINFIGGSTADGCHLVPTSVFQRSVEARLDPGCKPPEPALLFVPGYGASMNLSFLLNPSPDAPLRDGWYFTPFLTKSYDAFLEEARDRKIMTGVAYYDWRRPPDTIVRDYLIPALDALKQNGKVSSVYLVAHSFGGIVSRSYIQSSSYRGDVAGLVMLGTPNAGSVKSYGAWQGASFPTDWEVMNQLLRFYKYKYAHRVDSDVMAVRTFFPSLQSLLPTGPVLFREGAYESLVESPNVHLSRLNQDLALLHERVPYTLAVSGTGQQTPGELAVGPRNKGHPLWPDGQVTSIQRYGDGDGTVLVSSSELQGVSALRLTGWHADLPELAAGRIFNLLYPAHVPPPPAPARGAARNTANIFWFLVDCPVTVQITTPSGLIMDSGNAGVSESVAVLYDPESVWMLAPEEEGEYRIVITALATTEVRWWQGNGSITTFTLEKDRQESFAYVARPSEEGPSHEEPEVPPPVVPATPWDPPVPGKYALASFPLTSKREVVYREKDVQKQADPFSLTTLQLVGISAVILARRQKRDVLQKDRPHPP
ncbi:MAG TPA: hypothetical protein VLA04_00100 [Verrucomicrobiae bacterium]|nr:hypothetical protein [Verrucomicrobiae bacterium]